MPPDQLFLSQLPHIKRVVAQTCRRCHFRKEEAEDFEAELMVKLIEDDYAVLRRFEGRSSLERYLTVVIKRFHLDYLDRIWGPWQPCAEAVRLGPVAKLLDKLLNREGFTFDEAVETLRTNHQVELSWQQLHAMAVRFPRRWPHRAVDEEALKNLPSSFGKADEGVMDRENAALWTRVLEALDTALRSLAPEDRLILRMQLWNRFTIPQIAKALHLDEKHQKQLYRRIDRIQEHLRERMEHHGIRKEDIQVLFSDE